MDEVIKAGAANGWACDCHARSVQPWVSRMPMYSWLRRLAEYDVAPRRPLSARTAAPAAPEWLPNAIHQGRPVGAHFEVAQQGDRPARAVLLKQRKKIAPNSLQGIGNRAPVDDLAMRRRYRVGIEASGGSFAEPGARASRRALTVIFEVGHIYSQLLVGDGFVGNRVSV